MDTLAVGVDLVAGDAVAEALDRFANRYVMHISTDDEVADCRDAGGALVAERLAGGFAAKEAILKVIGLADDGLPWRQISIQTGRFGAPSVMLRGRTLAAAVQRRAPSLAVSLAHEGSFAAAVAVPELAVADEP